MSDAYRPQEVSEHQAADTTTPSRLQTALLLETGQSLQRISAALLHKRTNLDNVLEIVCHEARTLTGATGSVVLLLDNDGWLRVATSSGHPSPAMERLSVDDSLAGAVIKQGEPLLLNNLQDQVQAYYRNPSLQTLLAVPLCADGTNIGVLDVVNKPGGFTEQDIGIIALFADQAAIAIENARLNQQAEKLAVIEERQRLARELHDSVTQTLYSVTLYADAAGMALSSGKTAVAAEHLEDLRLMAREAMLDMRLLIFELHPPILEAEGLATALQTRLEAVEARSGLQVDLQLTGTEEKMPIALEEALYRIAQEALNNAVKHAHAQQVTIQLRYADDQFRLTIRDNGTGFDPQQARQSAGLGLRNIEERVQRIKGRLTIASSPGAGTAVTVEVPRDAYTERQSE